MYWIDTRDLPHGSLAGSDGSHGRLAIIAWPRGGASLESDVIGWKAEGIDTVVSLLESAEVDEIGLGQESELCSQQGLEFVHFPIPDGGVPASVAAVADLADALAGKLRNGRNIAFHCRAGMGRSPVVAACVMIRGGFIASHAFDRINAARGVQVPDKQAQRAWVESFQFLGRRIPG